MLQEVIRKRSVIGLVDYHDEKRIDFAIWSLPIRWSSKKIENFASLKNNKNYTVINDVFWFESLLDWNVLKFFQMALVILTKQTIALYSYDVTMHSHSTHRRSVLGMSLRLCNFLFYAQNTRNVVNKLSFSIGNTCIAINLSITMTSNQMRWIQKKRKLIDRCHLREV